MEPWGESAAAGFCPWSDGCGEALWDRFISFERAGEGRKHFSGEESVAFWLVGGDAEANAEEADIEGGVGMCLGFSGPLRSASCLPFE